MKGLLIKDFGVITSNKRMLYVFGFIAVFMLFINGKDGGYFAMSYLTIICGMQVLTTISYDEFDHSNAFLMTLPISRKLYAAEKYVFLVITMLIGALLAVTVSILMITVSGGQIVIGEWVIGALLSALAIYLMMLLVLPLQLRFGGDNGKMVLLACVACIFILAFLARGICSLIGVDLESALTTVVDGYLNLGAVKAAVLGAVAVFVGTIISLTFSIRIMEKKQF